MVHLHPEGNFPDALVIGVQKAGTSAVHNYLNQNPQVITSFKKEVHFFDKDENYRRGTIWYKNQFPSKKSTQISVESTPSYIFYPKAIKRIHALNNSIKLVILLRDPIDRAYSAWNMYKQLVVRKPGYLKKVKHHNELRAIQLMSSEANLLFEHVINEELECISKGLPTPWPKLIERGFYSHQIKFLHSLFPKENTHFILSEKLKTNPEESLKSLSNFLNIGPFNLIKNKRINERSYDYALNKVISPTTYLALINLYKEKNQDLHYLINKEILWRHKWDE